MSPVCAGIKRDGGRCTQGVKPGETWCYNHDPNRSEERKRAASRAGKSRSGREISEAKKLLDSIVSGVLRGTTDKGAAAVAVQAINAKRGLLELERRIRELEDLERRIADLEERYGQQSSGRSHAWG